MDGKQWQTFKPLKSDCGRIMLLYDYEIDRGKIPEYFSEENTIIIKHYEKYKRFGLPYSGGWARNPAYIIEILEALDDEVDRVNGSKRKN